MPAVIARLSMRNVVLAASVLALGGCIYAPPPPAAYAPPGYAYAAPGYAYAAPPEYYYPAPYYYPYGYAPGFGGVGIFVGGRARFR